MLDVTLDLKGRIVGKTEAKSGRGDQYRTQFNAKVTNGEELGFEGFED
jgi:hypothetical protein